MIARAVLSYDAGKVIYQKCVDPVTGEAFFNEMTARIAGPYLPDLERSRTSEYAWGNQEILLDTETDGPWLTGHGIAFEVKSFKGTMPLTAILPAEATGAREVKVYVQIPHIGLLAMDQVKVVEDYCTNQLQGELDDGWRILCVCPPNAARRPDYILGRSGK